MPPVPTVAINAQALREARYAKGLHQSQLAEQCGITQQYVSLLENGEKEVSQVVLGRLAAVLDVTRADLLPAVTDQVVSI